MTTFPSFQASQPFTPATMYLLQHCAENATDLSFARIMQEVVLVLWVPHGDNQVNQYSCLRKQAQLPAPELRIFRT